jgi:ABC-type glycerol-3-phosphate transport system permease component
MKRVAGLPAVVAGMPIAALPRVAVYVSGQRCFIRRLTAGGVKGN